MPNPAVLKKLAGYDTPTICNVIELFEVRPLSAGYMDARIKAAFPDFPPIVGFAATATFRAAAQVPSRQGYADIALQVERFAELDGPAILVFQDLDDPPAAAAFGEVMCSTYRGFGAQGLITNGAGRDLDQVHALGFSVFTGGTICSHGYHQIPSIHVPARVGGVTVFPNDLLHADVNGVTTIPPEIAAEVADLCDEYIALEAIIIDTVRRDSVTLTELRQAMAESSAVKASLRARVSRAKKS